VLQMSEMLVLTIVLGLPMGKDLGRVQPSATLCVLESAFYLAALK